MVELRIVSDNEGRGPDLNDKVAERLETMARELHTLLVDAVATPVPAAVTIEDASEALRDAAAQIRKHIYVLDGSSPRYLRADRAVHAQQGRASTTPALIRFKLANQRGRDGDCRGQML